MIRQSVTAIVLIALVGIVSGYLRYVRPQPDRLPVFGSIPMQFANFYGEERRFSDRSYEVLQADTTTLRFYYGPEQDQYWLFIGYFRSQKYGSQIHSPKHCLPGEGWKIGEIHPYLLRLPNGNTKEINRLLINEANQRQLMLYWFETRGGSIRSEYGLKWDLMKNSLLIRPTDAAIIRLNLPLHTDETIEMATNKAVTFLDEFYPQIMNALPFGNQ